MSKKDLLFLSLWSCLILMLPGFGWIIPGQGLFNFGDLYSYHYPLLHLANSTLEAGRLPFWNPYIFAGLPLAANSQAALFYPLSICGRILPLLFSFSIENLFHLWWAGLGLALLARHQGLKSGSAWLLGFSYGLCPFLVYRIAEGVPTILASLAWAPWAWLAWTNRNKTLLAGVLALQFFSGHPQFMVLNAVALLIAARVSPEPSKNLATLIIAATGAAALAAIQWVPTAEFLAHSMRRHWAEAYSLGYSLNGHEFLSWLWPCLAQSPFGHDLQSPISVLLETSSGFPGLAILFLAAIGIWRKPKGLPSILIALGLFFAWGRHNPIYVWLLSHTALSLLRTPARFSFLSLWGLFLAAGITLKSEKKSRAVFPIVSLLAIAQLFFWDRNFIKTSDAAPYLKPNLAFAQALAGKPQRILIDPKISNPDKAMMYRAMNVNGYDAFYLEGYPLYAFQSEGRAAADASRAYLKKWDTHQMRDLGVGWFLSKSGRLDKLPIQPPLTYFVDKNGNSLSETPNLEIKRPEDWHVVGNWPPQATRLVLSEPFYPGWRAYLNGHATALSPWNGFLMSVPRPKNSKSFSLDLALLFWPSRWMFLALLSTAAWLIWLKILLRQP
jgi:hypothetical protein